MTALFVATFLALIGAELLKGLSANGTPPVLQRFGWQIHLAHFMWRHIGKMRIAAVALLVLLAVLAPPSQRQAMAMTSLVLIPVWGGIWWLFNRFWVGRYKFLPIRRKRFVGAEENRVDPSLQVIGVDLGGERKAYPVNMLFYHHQIPDEVGGRKVWVTYCGLCRSGRVYDAEIDGRPLDFTLVGAINYNAVFADNQTGSWWRQETGEAAKGPLAGRVLADLPFEQMRLSDWLERHPDSTVLQYDPAFTDKYTFLARLLNYEASLPRWHMQETPPLVIGVEIAGQPRAWDFEELKRRRAVTDRLAGVPLLIVADPAGVAAFAYDRRLDGTKLDFTVTEEGIIDTDTGSTWDHLGRCIAGARKGARLEGVQSYQQFLRAWITFHPTTTFHDFTA